MQGPNELFTGDTAKVLGDTPHPDADGIVFLISGPNHQRQGMRSSAAERIPVLHPIG